jgi:hypothetical protein
VSKLRKRSFRPGRRATKLGRPRALAWQQALFIATVCYLVGYPLWIQLNSLWTGGISRQGDLLVVDLRVMGNFEMDQSAGTLQDIPLRFRDLDGKRVMLSGQMRALNSASGRVSGFQLYYSLANCCFTGPPKVQHLVKCNVSGNCLVEYRSGLVNVIGTLHVGPETSEGRLNSIYRLDVGRLDP